MPLIRPCPLPPKALLTRYADGYADCYTTELSHAVTHAQFVEAFYTSNVFKVERFFLMLILSRPSTDTQARQLAAGEIGAFSAWHVEDRATDQLLMCDLAGRTRSWFMTAQVSGGPATQLYFGSAVVPARHIPGGKPEMGLAFTALLGFHRLYSRILLGAARARLARAGAMP